MTRVMYDAVDVSQIPHDATAVAGYVDGHWQTFPSLRRFKANRLSIAVTAAADAACLDVETGDATPQQVPAWVRRQLARGVRRPVIYASRDLMPAILAELRAAPISIGLVRLWSAHYGVGPHICGPVTCGAGFHADATQWTDRALGRNLDESLLTDEFFPPAPKHKARLKVKTPPKPHPKVTAGTLAAALSAALEAAVHAAGLKITPAEAGYVTTAVGGLVAYLFPRGPR